MDYPNDHVEEKHQPDWWLFEVPRHEYVEWDNGEKKLYVRVLYDGKRAAGIITEQNGAIKTGFVAPSEYWLNVIRRDGYK